MTRRSTLLSAMTAALAPLSSCELANGSCRRTAYVNSPVWPALRALRPFDFSAFDDAARAQEATRRILRRLWLRERALRGDLKVSGG
jgi:hypothetical protein